MGKQQKKVYRVNVSDFPKYAGNYTFNYNGNKYTGNSFYEYFQNKYPKNNNGTFLITSEVIPNGMPYETVYLDQNGNEINKNNKKISNQVNNFAINENNPEQLGEVVVTAKQTEEGKRKAEERQQQELEQERAAEELAYQNWLNNPKGLYNFNQPATTNFISQQVLRDTGLDFTNRYFTGSAYNQNFLKNLHNPEMRKWDYFGLSLLAPSLMFSGSALAPVMTTANTLLTPSTYTTLMGLPTWVGTVANTGTAGYFAGSALSDFIYDPSLENAGWTALSLLPITRAGTNIKPAGTLIQKGISKINPRWGKYYQSNLIDNEILTQGYNKIFRHPLTYQTLSKNANDYIYNVINAQAALENQLQATYNTERYTIDYPRALYNLISNKQQALGTTNNLARANKVSTRPSNISIYDPYNMLTHGKDSHIISNGVDADVTMHKNDFPIFQQGQTTSFDLPPFSDQTIVKINPDYTYTASTSNGLPFNVPNELRTAIQNNIDYVQQNYPGSVPFGSAVSVKEGNLMHIPGDIDVFITENQMNSKFGKNWPSRTRNTTSGNKQLVDTYVDDINSGIFGKDGELDLNVLYNARNGSGTEPTSRSLELFQQLYPDEYYAAVGKARRNHKIDPLSYDKDYVYIWNVEIPYTPEQMLQKLNENKEIKTIMDNMNASPELGSADGKAKQLVRTYQYLQYADSKLMEKALRMNGESYLGTAYRSAPVSIDQFTNIEHNKEILQALGAPEGVIKTISEDPYKMKNYFEYWWQNTTLSSRGLNKLSPTGVKKITGNPEDDAQYFMRNWDGGNGGTYSGTGLNTVQFGNSGHFGGAYGTIQSHIPIKEGTSPLEIVKQVRYRLGMDDFELPPEMRQYIKDNFGIYFNTFREFVNYDYPVSPETAKKMDDFARKFGIDAHTLSNNNSIQYGNIDTTGRYGNSLFRGFLRKLDHPEDLIKIGSGEQQAPGSEISRQVRVAQNKQVMPHFQFEPGTHRIPSYLIPKTTNDKRLNLQRFATQSEDRLLDLYNAKIAPQEAEGYTPKDLGIRYLPLKYIWQQSNDPILQRLHGKGLFAYKHDYPAYAWLSEADKVKHRDKIKGQLEFLKLVGRDEDMLKNAAAGEAGEHLNNHIGSLIAPMTLSGSAGLISGAYKNNKKNLINRTKNISQQDIKTIIENYKAGKNVLNLYPIDICYDVIDAWRQGIIDENYNIVE